MERDVDSKNDDDEFLSAPVNNNSNNISSLDDDNYDEDHNSDDDINETRINRKTIESGLNNENDRTNDNDRSNKRRDSSSTTNQQQELYYLKFNDPSFLETSSYEYPNNEIISSKYTIITFLPLNLFEQFRRIANIYFLMIIGIQTIPNVTPFSIWSSVTPLVLILSIGAIKDGIEDWKRHQDDKRANSLPTLRLDPNRKDFRITRAIDLKVGDLLQVKRGEEIPADCIVLCSSQKDGTCYISTASLDGENAPKPRRSVKTTSYIRNGRDLLSLRGKIECSKNTKSLHGFQGNIQLLKGSLPQTEDDKNKNESDENETINNLSLKTTPISGIENASPHDANEYLLAKTSDPSIKSDVKTSDDYFISALGDEHFIFRGSKLANTEYIFCVVLFVGSETKLMLNRNQVPFKFSKFEKILNQCILIILIFNFLLCISLGLAANLVHTPWYELRRNNWATAFLKDSATWLVLTSWMIPFSLYVTMELIKMIQAQWISWDEKLAYYVHDPYSNNNSGIRKSIESVDSHSNQQLRVDEVNNNDNNSGNNNTTNIDKSKYVPRNSKAKNSNLNEELGHVDYVFTDKTGTLTQNQMELCKLSIMGKKYQNDIKSSNSNSGALTSSNVSIIPINDEYTPLSELIRSIMSTQIGRKSSKTNLDHLDEDETVLDNREIHFFYNLLLCSSTLAVPKHKPLNYMDLTQDFIDGVSSTNNLKSDNITNETNNINNYGSTLHVDEEKKDDSEEKKKEESNDIEYMSPSPDEVAFAEALADHGIVLEERNANSTISIRLHPRSKNVRKKGALSQDDESVLTQFRVLATLDFTASRKRMTVIIEDSEKNIFLYTKGADSVIFNLCGDVDKSLIMKTKRHVTKFAKTGSRTLVMAFKPLKHEQFKDFEKEFRKAEVSLTKREERIEKAFAILEHNCYLLGTTAVEDQMQELVQETVLKLKEANIKVIMLTGDKQETAVSIGRQSGIIPDKVSNNDLMYISARLPQDYNDFSALEKQMLRVEKKLKQYIKLCKKKKLEFKEKSKNLRNKNSTNNDNMLESEITSSETANSINNNLRTRSNTNTNKDFEAALVINGDALELSLHPLLENKFFELYDNITTIVCNRANPTQKSQLVSKVKNRLSGVALAIGDGANDISMIQSSSVGVGIMGKEGTQAALAADFVIHRFHHLNRLLFVHGRFSFLRTSTVALISLYKNMAFNLPLAYFAFFSLYTAQTMFDPYMMTSFNMFFTALFPLVVGAFEKDINDDTSLNHPKAYYFFKIDTVFNLKQFCFWMWTAIWQSLVFFYVVYFVTSENGDIWDSTGKNGGIWVWGTQMLTSAVVIICFKMMAETKEWNWLYYASTFIGLVLYFVALAVLENSLWFDSPMYKVMDFTFKSPIVWFCLLAQLVVCLIPGLLYNLYLREKKATLSTILNEAEKFGYLTINGEHRPTEDVVEEYLRR